MKRKLFPSAALLALAACGDPAAPERAVEPVVLATFHPLACFAERIAGGAVAVECVLPPGADPAEWQPPREVLARLQSARLVAANGAALEPWLAAAALPESRLAVTARSVPGGFVEREAVTHRHGPGGEHTHGGLDPHTFVDPTLAAHQAGVLARAMERAWPEQAQTFRANAQALDAELRGLGEAFAALAPRLAGVELLAAHPAYDYLARAHGLAVTSFDLAPGEPLDEGSRAAVAAALTTDRPALMLWEAEPGDAARAALAELGVASAVYDPGENPDPAALAEGEDWLAIQKANLARLEAALPR